MHRPQWPPPHAHTNAAAHFTIVCSAAHWNQKQTIIESIFKETLRVKITKMIFLVWIKVLQEVNDGEILHVSPEWKPTRHSKPNWRHYRHEINTSRSDYGLNRTGNKLHNNCYKAHLLSETTFHLHRSLNTSCQAIGSTEIWSFVSGIWESFRL